jgi:hypothetical protein
MSFEEVRIIGEFAKRRALSTPSGPSPQTRHATAGYAPQFD